MWIERPTWNVVENHNTDILSKSKLKRKLVGDSSGERMRILRGLNKIRDYKKIHLMPPFSCKKISLYKIYITKCKESVAIRVWRYTQPLTLARRWKCRAKVAVLRSGRIHIESSTCNALVFVEKDPISTVSTRNSEAFPLIHPFISFFK